MKSILTILLVAGAFYLSSCKDNSGPINVVPVVPSTDSVTKNGFLQITFAGKSFYINDLVVQSSPVYTLFANTQATDQKDTLWISQIQMTDHQSKTISLDFTSYNNTSGGAIGDYMIRTNNSTLTDFSEGKNTVYSVSVGSKISISHTAFTTEGTLTLNLYYNHISYPATGSFKIYN